MCQYLENWRRYVQSYYLWLIGSCICLGVGQYLSQKFCREVVTEWASLIKKWRKLTCKKESYDMHIFDWSAAGIARERWGRKGRGTGRDGKGRGSWLSCAVKTGPPIGYGRPDFNRLRVIHRYDGQTDRRTIEWAYSALCIGSRALKITVLVITHSTEYIHV